MSINNSGPSGLSASLKKKLIKDINRSSESLENIVNSQQKSKEQIEKISKDIGKVADLPIGAETDRQFDRVD